MPDDPATQEPPAKEPATQEPGPPAEMSFPRGAARPPQALPAGANWILLAISIAAVGGTLATLAWLFAL